MSAPGTAKAPALRKMVDDLDEMVGELVRLEQRDLAREASALQLSIFFLLVKNEAA